MAKTTITQITDDLDGTKDAQEVSFSFQGVDYAVDLGKKNLAAFEKAIKPYLDAATRVSKRQPTTRRNSKSGPSGRDLAAVRQWAKSNGLAVSERGRVAKTVLEQYDAANS